VIGVGIFDRADHLPPATDGGHGKLGGVAACADVDKSLIAAKIIDAVRNGNPFGIGGKIMVKHCDGLLAPFTAWLMKRANQFPAFGIHGKMNAEDRALDDLSAGGFWAAMR